MRSECVELYILPPDTIDSNKAIAAYRVVKSQNSKCSLIPSQPSKLAFFFCLFISDKF